MILVLGGGISGLAVAYQLQQQNQEFLLVERDAEVGGKIQSVQTEGFTIEKGPNTVLINNKEIKALLDDLELTAQIVKPDPIAIKNRFVLYQNRILALPTSPSSAIKSPLVGWSTLFKVLGEPFYSKVEKEESLADFSRRRLGKQVYENFIYPFVTGIYAGDPEKMSMNFTLKMLKELELKHGSILRGAPKMMKANKAKAEKEQLPKEKIFTFKKGLQELPKTMASHFESKLRLSAEVISIHKQPGGGYEVKIKDEAGSIQLMTVDKIISTIPFHDFKRTLSSDAAGALKSQHIDYVPAFVYHFGFKKGDCNIPQKSFGLLSREKETVPFLGILFNSQFFPHTAPDDSELITVITGGAKLRQLKEMSDAERKEQVLQSINQLFEIEKAPIFQYSTTWLESIPQYNMGHQSIIDEIKMFEEQNEGLFIMGNYMDGISVSDCISKGVQFVKTNFS